MATQRLIVATLAGQSAVAVSGLFEKWRSVLDPEAVDRLCLSIERWHYPSPVSLSVAVQEALRAWKGTRDARASVPPKKSVGGLGQVAAEQ